MAQLVLRSVMKYCSWILWMKYHFMKEKHFHRSSLSPVATETNFLEDSRWGASLINRKFAWKQHGPVIIIGIYGVGIKLLLFRAAAVVVIIFQMHMLVEKSKIPVERSQNSTETWDLFPCYFATLMKSDIHSLYLVLCSHTVSIQISCCLLTL